MIKADTSLYINSESIDVSFCTYTDLKCVRLLFNILGSVHTFTQDVSDTLTAHF